MNPTSRSFASTLWPTALALALLMLLTRVGHLGEFSRLPDASWAVFFLGGRQLRDARGFAAFFVLAWGIDVLAVALGTPADCFSLGYLFLLPSYAALWWGGRLSTSTAATTPGAVTFGAGGGAALLRGASALAASVLVAFLVSNAGFHAFGPASTLGIAEYATRVAPYLPMYVVVAAIYAGLAVVATRAAVRLRRALAR